MTTAEQSSTSDAFVSAYTQGAGLPETENTVTGAAQHRDLYRKAVDPAAKRKAEAGQARVLGLGFLVFFAILSSISFWINGALYPFAAAWKGIEKPVEGVFYPEEEEPTGDREEARGARLGDASHFNLEWSDGSRSPVSIVPQDEDPAEGVTVVWVRVNEDWTALTAPKKTGVIPAKLVLFGNALPPKDQLAREQPVRVGYLHAWHTAELMGLFPTHCLLYVGGILGALGLLVPVVLLPFYRFWMKFVTAPLGFVNTRLILGIVYFLVVTPMALVIKVFGKDRLRRAKLPEGETYWVTREKQRDHKHFEKGF